MKQVTYIDKYGRKYERLIPDGAPMSHAKMGIQLGPPDLSTLGLGLEVTTRLHNQLHARGILTARDAEQRLNEVSAALMAALKVDAVQILDIYAGRLVSGEPVE